MNQELANFVAGFKAGFADSERFNTCQRQAGANGYSAGYRFGFEAGLVTNATSAERPTELDIARLYGQWKAGTASISPEILDIAAGVISHKLKNDAGFPKNGNPLEFIARVLQRKVR